MPVKRIDILGVPFDQVTQELVLSIINETLEQSNHPPLFIATPNPEMVLTAKKNPNFSNTLNNTHLNIPDGTGILWAATYLEKAKYTRSKTIKLLLGLSLLPLLLVAPRRFREPLPQKITGTDLLPAICKHVPPKTRIFLLGGKPGIAQKTQSILEQKYKNIIVVGTNDGSADEANDKKLQNIITQANPQVLFVAFGAPKQELWIQRNLAHLPRVKIAIGVGGAFDYISGTVHRAPAFMRKLGLEWLFRLIRQPQRLIRIFNATIRFPFKVIQKALR